jgi:very-short-patch-repair endonuclease
MAAVLSCGSEAAVSHGSAAALWGIAPETRGIEVSVPAHRRPRRPGVIVHRRRTFDASDVTRFQEIPVTNPICTLIDLAARLSQGRLERAIGEADKRNLVDPETLREALDEIGLRRGAAVLRKTLDRQTFVLTESELERRILPIARRAGLDQPLTQQVVNGLKVDFFWRDLGLVVEVDGLRYHRTPEQQARDRRRDQMHQEAGMTPLRFTYAQVAFEADEVESTLTNVARRLRQQSD